MNKEELDKMYEETGMQVAVGMCAYGPTSNNHWIKMSGIGTALPMNFRNPMGVEIEEKIKEEVKEEIAEDLDELAQLQKQQICSNQDNKSQKFKFNIKLTKL